MSIFNYKIIARWEHHYMRLLLMKDVTRIDLFYFDDNFRRIAQWDSAFRQEAYKHKFKVQSNTLLRSQWYILIKLALSLAVISVGGFSYKAKLVQ